MEKNPDLETLIERYGDPKAPTNGQALEIFKDAADCVGATAGIHWYIKWTGDPNGSESFSRIYALMKRKDAKRKKLRTVALRRFLAEEFDKPKTAMSKVSTDPSDFFAQPVSQGPSLLSLSPTPVIVVADSPHQPCVTLTAAPAGPTGTPRSTAHEEIPFVSNPSQIIVVHESPAPTDKPVQDHRLSMLSVSPITPHNAAISSLNVIMTPEQPDHPQSSAGLPVPFLVSCPTHPEKSTHNPETAHTSIHDSFATPTSSKHLTTPRARPLLHSEKSCNLLDADIAKKKKHLSTLQSNILDSQTQLASLGSENNYFKVKNVMSRERNFKRTISSLRLKHSTTSRKLRRSKAEVSKLLENNGGSLLNDAKGTILKEQKMKSYYKCKDAQITAKFKKCKKDLRASEKLVKTLQKKILSIENADFSEPGEGAYSDNVRLCVYELLSLEVGIAKVSPVIASVALRIFNTSIEVNHLPSRQTALRMADEAQFLALRYYAEKLNKSDNHGIKKDGTSRNRVNMLNTTIVLSSGEVCPLGFVPVARETAQAITDTTKTQLEEIQWAAKGDNAWKAEVLSKMSFVMSDRAANEKKSNRQIGEWVQEELKTAGLPPTEVHPMYCMTHVLLGFHREVVASTSVVQKSFAFEDGKVGRDSEENFSHYRFENIATRVVRNTCAVLGPNGDEKRSVRSKWLADCRERHVKSLIGDYKDNRFNGLFEAAAQILHHVDDILALWKKLPEDPNWKVKSTFFDLRDSRVITVLQAHALFFVKVTEPYRLLMVSKDIGYLNLGKYLTSIWLSFNALVTDPDFLLDADFTLGMTHPLDTRHTLFQTATSIRCPDRLNILLKMIGAMAEGCVKVMNNQVPEFLPGGALHKPPSPVEMKRTEGSGLNNITVERHFGTLDSSMKRRRHCTLHHHSSILILKSQGKQIINWLAAMPIQESSKEMKDARLKGQELRKKHREEAAQQLTEEQAALERERLAKEAKALRLEKRKTSGKSYASSSFVIKEAAHGTKCRRTSTSTSS